MIIRTKLMNDNNKWLRDWVSNGLPIKIIDKSLLKQYGYNEDNSDKTKK